MLKTYCTLQTLFIAGRDRLRGDNEKGATAVEYGILVAFIAVAIIGAVTLFGQQLSAVFDNIVKQLAPAAGSGSVAPK